MSLPAAKYPIVQYFALRSRQRSDTVIDVYWWPSTADLCNPCTVAAGEEESRRFSNSAPPVITIHGTCEIQGLIA